MAEQNPTTASPAKSAPALRTDGPTLKQYVDAGYKAENYPPQGYAARSDEAEAFERPAVPAVATDVPVGRFPSEDTPEQGGEFKPAPGRFPAE